MGMSARVGDWEEIAIGNRIGGTNRHYEAVSEIRGFFTKST